MKQIKITLALLIVMLFASTPVFSQITQEEITEGTDYWFGITRCGRSPSENIRWGQYPISLWVSSKVDTRVSIESKDGSMSKMTYVIRANQIRVISIGDNLEMKESEVVKPYGIHLTSDDPVTLAVFVAYKWSGEAYRITPVQWLGLKYYALCLYQDKCKMMDGNNEYKQGQILIIATEDKTTVNYTPKAELEKTKKDKTGSVTLNKGECYLLLNKVIPTLNQSEMTDLTGTLIQADKPIAVISGHTKGAFPKYSDIFLGSLKSDFMRNMYTEMMWPVELCDDEYVSAPIKYRNRYNYGTIAEDEGDLIRFIATEDNTEIYQSREDGIGGLKKMCAPLKAGQYFEYASLTRPAYFKATHPVVVGQYGKAWWDHAVLTNKNDDNPANPSRNGQGMLLTLAPMGHWCTYASFKLPDGMDNFIYCTFQYDSAKNISLDGIPITTKFGSSAIKVIPGTQFGFLTENIGSGDHFFEAKKGTTFAAYAYGNWDYAKDGFAYGYPVGINYASPCEDSLTVTDNMNCGNVDGEAIAIPDTASCAGLYSILFKSSLSTNYAFSLNKGFKIGDKKAQYQLQLVNPKQEAVGVIIAMTKSGKAISKKYEYFPELIKITPTFLDYEMVPIGESKDMKFTITNIGKSECTIKALRLKDKKAEFSITTTDFPVTLQPNGTKEVTVKGSVASNFKNAIEDSVIATLSCYEQTIVGLKISTGEPDVTMNDISWGSIPINNEVENTFVIRNIGSADAVFTAVEWPDKLHFTRTDIDGKFPFTLEPNQTKDVRVWYKPNEAGIPHKTRATFTVNATKTKLYSDWDGIGIDAGPTITGYDWQTRRILDKYNDSTNGYNYFVTVNCIGNSKITVKDIVIENDPDNVFSVGNYPTELIPNDPKTLSVTFKPKAEKVYESDIKINAIFDGNTLSATAKLKGIGQQPHAKVQGKDFGNAILKGTSINDKGMMFHLDNPVGQIHDMPLTIKRIYIDGVDKDAFEILPTFFTDNTFPLVMPVGAPSLDIPIKFSGLRTGVLNAKIVAETDAPELTEDGLIGRVRTEGLESGNKYFGKIFKGTTTTGTSAATGSVFVTNTGSGDVTLTQPVKSSLSGDVVEFDLTYVRHVSKDGTQKAKYTADTKDIILSENDTLFVDGTFTPTLAKSYKGIITYSIEGKDNAGNPVLSYPTSELTGDGMEFWTKVYIPQYKSNYTGSVVNAEFMIKNNTDKNAKHDPETKPLVDANITAFKAMVDFKVPSGTDQLVFPESAGETMAPSDIILSGTMLDGNGWVCTSVDVDKSYIMTVHFVNNNNIPLNNTTDNGKSLFKFKMKTFLSSEKTVTLNCDLAPQDAISMKYVNVENSPGLIEVIPVCADPLRPIIMSGTYALTQNTPNPVDSKTTLTFSIAFEAQTTLTLYNSRSEVVAVLVDGMMKPGAYDYTIDVNAMKLSSGNYFYNLKSGTFNETKSFIIVK